MSHAIGVCAILGSIVLGCGPGAPGGTSAESGSGEASSNGGGSGGATASTSGAATSSTSLATSLEPEPTGGDPATACGPPPETAGVAIRIDGSDPVSLGDVRFERPCVVAELTPEPAGGYAIGFDCVDESELPVAHSLALELDPGGVAPVAVGESVRLRVHNDNPFYANAFVTVRDPEGGLLLAYASAEALPSAFTDEHLAEYFPPSDFYAPLELVSAWPCEAECEPGGGFIVNDCRCRRRGAVDFTLDGETARVFEDGHGELAGAQLDLRVDVAGSIVVEDCQLPTDSTGSWTRLLVTRRP